MVLIIIIPIIIPQIKLSSNGVQTFMEVYFLENIILKVSSARKMK